MSSGWIVWLVLNVLMVLCIIWVQLWKTREQKIILSFYVCSVIYVLTVAWLGYNPCYLGDRDAS